MTTIDRSYYVVGAGCFRQVAASHSDHYRQVPLVGAGCFKQVAASHSDHFRQDPLYLHNPLTTTHHAYKITPLQLNRHHLMQVSKIPSRGQARVPFLA